MTYQTQEASLQQLLLPVNSGGKWKFVHIYLDDILIVSPSFQEHLTHVEQVLNHLSEAGLRLKPAKCAFAQKKIDYLGFTLSAEGVYPNSAKVVAVQNFPRPTDAKSVRRFLGIVNFYRKHVKDMAAIARPLTALTRKDKQTCNNCMLTDQGDQNTQMIIMLHDPFHCKPLIISFTQLQLANNQWNVNSGKHNV